VPQQTNETVGRVIRRDPKVESRSTTNGTICGSARGCGLRWTSSCKRRYLYAPA